jgi:hypothetical protein
VSANDHGVATRVVEPDAPVAALSQGAGHAATFASTEHFNLQTARALTVSEANGRASIYLAALSSNLIALAFIGQMSRLGVAFYAFALILLPVLAFVGTVTFVRLVQSSVEDIAYAHRIGLVRSYYLRVSPELEPYLVVLRGTQAAPFHGAPGAWQLTLTAAGMVAVVNSRRAGGLRRPGTGRRGRPLARHPGSRRSARRSRCLLAARTPPPSGTPQLPPGGCRSRRDPDSASPTVPRGLKTNHHVADLTWLPGPPPARRRRPRPTGPARRRRVPERHGVERRGRRHADR